MKYLPWFFIFALLCGCHKKQPPPPKPSFPVTVTEALEKPADLFIETLGHAESMTSVSVRSRIGGELTGIFFRQGQEVKQGDLLFTIDPKPYEATLQQTRGTLNETLANLALAEEKVKRYRTLAKEEFYSQIDYETLQSNYAALRAQSEQNQGQLDRAAIDLDYCWIYAPIDGKTGILQIDYGNLIKADGDNPLITLNQMTPIFVTFAIPEFELPRVRKYYKQETLRVLAAFDNFDKEPFEGTLYMLDNEVNTETGMIKIRATFDNEERHFWPGQFVRIRLILTTVKNATVIPFSAVQMTTTGPIVFVVKEDMTVSQRKVQLGQRQDSQVIVLDGVKPGEKLVVEGQINLSDGSKVFLTARAP